MREILFRGKRIDNGEWVEGYVTRIKHSDDKGKAESYYFNALDELGWVFEYAVSAETVCQYTGLIDKNGRKIFEGDIVDCHEKRGAAFWRCKVLWNEENSRFDVSTMDCGFPMCIDGYGSDIFIRGLDYKVIGNIFDNPELIGGKEE